VAKRGQRPDDGEWFISIESTRRDSLEQMDTYIHVEQRLTALHKMYARPLGDDYLDALRGCVRLSAQLGFVDTGIPMAWRLVEMVTREVGSSSDLVAESYGYLAQFAHLCRRENRFREALDLDSAARSWFSDHRGAYEHNYVASVAGVASDLAGLDDLDGAITALGAELGDPSSSLNRDPISRPAVRFGVQMKHYQRLRTRRERDNPGF
jgi:hypothetical protein